MRKKLGSLVIIAAIGWLGYTLYTTYGTLEPCAMLHEEVQIRVMDGQFEALGDLPALVVNSDDQIWCTKEFVSLHLR
ncbi:hypothetical protein ACFL12_03100 [Pseudomonadota bacterium]